MELIGNYNYDYIGKIMSLATEGSLLRRLINHAYSVHFHTYRKGASTIQGDPCQELIEECKAAGIQFEAEDEFGHTVGDYRVGGIVFRVVFT